MNQIVIALVKVVSQTNKNSHLGVFLSGCFDTCLTHV